MAVEMRRRCGYRKIGGLYLVGAPVGAICDRLPIPLRVCPCCNRGIKQARGWTWINVPLLVGGNHHPCQDEFACPLCMAVEYMGRAGLLWVGALFYPTPTDFTIEANQQGISRRIAAVPRVFKLGETWVLLAHSRGMACPTCNGAGLMAATTAAETRLACEDCDATGKLPAIFEMFLPHAIEKIITQSQSQDAELLAELGKQGITPVIVPDDDKDHQGTVYDDDKDEQAPMFAEPGK